MRVNVSNATFSSIVGIGEKILDVEKKTGRKFLKLNRGINQVKNIDLSKILPSIDPNTPEFQSYAPNTGHRMLKEAIMNEYQFENGDINNISITPGGMPALDLIFQLLNVENIYFPKFYWGSYSKIATIRKKSFSFYDDFLEMDISELNSNSCVLVCDPNNPTGIKLLESDVMEKIRGIQETGAIIIYDAPYKKLFRDYNAKSLGNCKNIIITESFSKWVGLPGLRLGFIYCTNEDFNKELNIRLLYEFNGVSSPSQVLLHQLLSTEHGKKAIDDFRNITVDNISKNIQYLNDNLYLPDDIYPSPIIRNLPLGIFAIVNKSEEFLFNHNIGSVGLEKFTYLNRDLWNSYSRICVSVPNDEFVKYFSRLDN